MWIVLEGPEGRRKVRPGEPYVMRPGERPVDIDRNDDSIPVVREDDRVGKLARHLGMDVADFVEWAASILGIPPCPKCQMSKWVLYRIDEIGWLRGIAMLWRVRWARDPTSSELSNME